jgi:tape measure domain-containing protein
MSVRDQTVRFNFKLLSELPTAIAQLEQITDIIDKQGKIAATNADAVKAALVRQSTDAKAAAQESLAISKEIAKQTTLEKQAELDRQNIQLKASEDQNTAYVRAQERERAAIAEQIAKQTTNEQQAELKRREIELQASEDRQTTIIREAEQRQTAAVRAALLEQAQIAQQLANQQTDQLKAELNQRTIATKAEADQQTAIVRAEQQRQTALLRAELSEQTALLRNQNAAFSELRNLVASAFGVYEIIEFGKQIIEAKSKIDIFRTGLQQMIGSKREADEVYGKLIEMAKTTPFEVEQLMETTFMLKGMGVATAELLPTLEALGNMAAVVGSDRLPRIAKAFTDVQNKGKLMKQEINQFAENGVPLYDLLVESMDKPRKKVIELAEAHEISFEQVKKALMDASSAGGRYYNLMALQAQTLGGQVSNLADRFFIAKAKLGDYFEDGLKVVIGGLAKLVDELGGSDRAIERNVALIKAAGAAWLTYQGVANAARIAESVLAAAVTVKNAAVAAGSLMMGTINLIMISAVGTTDLFTAAQVRSAAAARATWAVLVSNPLGAILLTVGALTTAYFAWQAAHVIVTEAISDQQLQLEKEQRSMKGAIESAMALTEGKKEHKAAVQALINKYPDYFAGLDAEKTTNAQLKQILDKVNDSYTTRIALAKEAYKTELNESKLKSLVEQQEQLMKVAAARLPQEVMLKVGGDASQLLKVIQEVPKYAEMLKGDWLTQIGDDASRLFGGINPTVALKQITAGLKEYETEVKASDERVKQIKVDNTAALTKIEDDRHEKVMAQLKAANKSRAAEEKLHTDNLAKISDTYRQNEEKATETSKNKIKTVTLNSAKQLAAAVSGLEQDTLKERIAALDAQEAAEIELINKVVVSKKASEAQLTALRAQALADIKGTHEYFETLRQQEIFKNHQAMQVKIQAEVDAFKTRNSNQQQFLELQTEGIQKFEGEFKTTEINKLKIATEGFKTIAKEAKASEKEVQEARKETARITEETTRIEIKSRREAIDLMLDFLGKQSGFVGEASKAIKAVINNLDGLNMQALENGNKAVEAAKYNLSLITALYNDNGKRSATDVANAEQQLANAENKTAKVRSESLSAALGVFSTVAQLAMAADAAIQESQRQVYEKIAQGLQKTRDSYKELYDFIKEAAKDAYQREMELFTGSLEEKIQKITEYYAKEKAFAEGQDRIDAQLAYYQRLAEIQAASSRSAEDFINLQKMRDDQALQQKIANAEREIAMAKEILDAKLQAIDEELEKDIAAKQAKIDKAEEERDKNLEILEQKLQDIKDSYARQIEAAQDAYSKELELLRDKQSQEKQALQEAYDFKQSLLAQSTEDESAALAIIDRLRLEALGRYEVSETAKLIATRERILATLTDEGERAAVTAAYDEKLRDLHSQVEDAKLDKTKGVSLATTQLKNEEKDKITALKEEEKTEIEKLDDAYQEKFKQLAADRDIEIQKLKDAQLIAEQKVHDDIVALQLSSATEIQNLMDQIAKQEAAAASDRLAANTEYTQQLLKANKTIFEANKAMKIAELRAEIAILEAQKGLFKNNAAINQAIDTINQAIGSITSLTFDTGSFGGATISSKFGKVNLALAQGGSGNFNNSKPPTGSPVTGNLPGGNKGDLSDIFTYATDEATGAIVDHAYDENSNRIEITVEKGHDFYAFKNDGTPIHVVNGKGYAPVTGKNYFIGTEFVEDAGAPNGIDTVPAWLTKGERVMTVDQNQQLGGITNEELVRRSSLFDQVSANFAELNNAWAEIGAASLRLPAGIVSAAGSQSIDLSELTTEMRATRKAIENKKTMGLNLDRSGFTVFELTEQAKITYYCAIQQR